LRVDKQRTLDAEGVPRLRGTNNVTIGINGGGFTFELDMCDEDPIVTMISLDPFLNVGYPIRIIPSSTQDLSQSQSFLAWI
jgi:hypothetical protein